MFPSLASLHDIFFCEDKCIEFLFQKAILDTITKCALCPSFVKREGKFFRCRSKCCRHRVSIYANSFFSRAHLKCNEVMLLLYLFLTKASNSTIYLILGKSQQAIADYRRFYAQLLANSLDDMDTIIGGHGVTIEVDESKLGKRKYNRGHRVDGAWILVGVEKTEQRKIFIESIPNRTAETLLEVISRHVVPGTTINTDCWKGYLNLPSIGMIHGTVNHSICFRDHVSGVNTNTVEGTNNGIKQMIPVRNRNGDSIDEHLSVFIWRRKHGADLWNGLLHALKITAYIG